MRYNHSKTRRDVWKRRTTAAGDLLLATLVLERRLAAQCFRKPTPESRRRWQVCQTTLSRLVEDYTHAVKQYRIVAEAGLVSRTRG